VLRALGLGDFLTGVPALRALAGAFPHHELVLAAPDPLAPLVRLCGAVDRLHPVPGLGDLGWPGPPPDLAVDLHGKGPESHRMLMAANPHRLVAFDCPEAGQDCPRWYPDEHEVHRWCRLVTEALGVPAQPTDLALSPPAVPPAVAGAVVVHPGAAYPARRWPPDRLAAVARWARDRGHDVVLTGSAAERPLAEEVRRAAGLPEGTVLAGQTDLEELAATVAAARLVVSGDTGVAHLATAYRRPSVVLFGPTPPAAWGPIGDGPHAVIWHGTGVGDPWGSSLDPALEKVTVAEVVERAEALLARTPPAPAESVVPTPGCGAGRPRD